MIKVESDDDIIHVYTGISWIVVVLHTIISTEL